MRTPQIIESLGFISRIVIVNFDNFCSVVFFFNNFLQKSRDALRLSLTIPTQFLIKFSILGNAISMIEKLCQATFLLKHPSIRKKKGRF